MLIWKGEGFCHLSLVSDGFVEKLRETKSPAIALSGHIGCFELLAAYHQLAGLSVTVVGRNPNYASLDQLLADLRASYGVKTVWRSDPGGLGKIIRALKQGGVIAVLIDQDTNLDNGFSPFFGVEAASPITPIKLALKHQIPIFSSFIVRTGHLKHQVIAQELPYDSSDPDAVKNILGEYNRRLEALIRRYPEQWFWWHRRWRRRPGVDYKSNPELLPSTNQYLGWLHSLKQQQQRYDIVL